MKILKLIYAGAVASVLMVTGCATDEYGYRLPMTNAEKGTLIGAGSAALIAGLVSGKTSTVLISAVGGGIAGALVGNYMDNQKKDLQRVLRPELNAGDITLESLPQNQLRISMTGATAFEVDSTRIKPGFYSTMNKLANVLNRYGKTQLVIVGHTDSTGSPAYNQELSVERAMSVEQYLLGQGVIPPRLISHGAGDTMPRASNDTPEGRRLNRRVEITVIPVVA